MTKLAVVSIAAAVGLLASARPSGAQEGRSIWDGVYSTTQAARGKAAFAETCARCHNLELTGSDRGPELKGRMFLSHWEDGTLEQIFNMIRDRMPPQGSNALSEGVKIDILAYLLQSNALPPGAGDLTPVSSALDAVRVERKGVRAGVYTSAQAEQGRKTYQTACAGCHGADLAGTTGPPLLGDTFVANWEADSLNALFAKIRDTMPPNAGEMLSQDSKLDVLAYILQANGFSGGTESLKVDGDALEAIRFARKGGSVAAANFSIVRVVGCLSRDFAAGWQLTSATEPVAAKDQPSTPDALRRAASQALSKVSFQLVSVTRFRPELQSGAKVE